MSDTPKARASSEWLSIWLRFHQHGRIARVLQIKKMIRRELMGQRGLAGPPRPEDGRNREGRRERSEPGLVGRSIMY